MEFTIPAHHPALAGHFPGHPVVPAVVILDQVAALLAEFRPGARLVRVVSAKFIAPLAPEQRCRVEFTPRSGGQIRFTCSVGGRTVASGLLETGDAAP
ncbi:hypothetical protein [Candidatus Methylocalor cossyra]|uniref:FabA-like domain-containing protein n=1 Tax=Candidatus Methylocalor cossyra TaxID=3108543 RepID=A0ABM9NHE3_9GAMM